MTILMQGLGGTAPEGWLAVLVSWLLPLVAVLLTGAAVKLADDVLDRHLDACRGRITSYNLLQEGSTTYALAFLAVAAALDPPRATSLFAAAYAVGMVGTAGERLPSGLKGYQESLLLLGGLGLWWGWQEIVSSLAVVGAWQLIDDMLDGLPVRPMASSDGRTPSRDRRASLGDGWMPPGNGRTIPGGWHAITAGSFRSIVLVVLLGGIGLAIDPLKTVAAAISGAFIEAGDWCLNRRKGAIPRVSDGGEG